MLQTLVNELKKQLDLKDSIAPGDIVIIAAVEPQMLFFAVISKIERDSSRKDEWWHISMQTLSVPMQDMTWTLRMEQACGQEIFTMGGQERFMAPIKIKKEPEKKKKERKIRKGKPNLRIIK